MNNNNHALIQSQIRENFIIRRNLMLSPESTEHPVVDFDETQQPMLYLEVNIGGAEPRAPGKLLLFEGDHPEEIVKCFAKVYAISENKKAKLLDIVKV